MVPDFVLQGVYITAYSDGNNVGDISYCIVPPEVIGNDAADLANKRQCQLSALFCASALANVTHH